MHTQTHKHTHTNIHTHILSPSLSLFLTHTRTRMSRQKCIWVLKFHVILAIVSLIQCIDTWQRMNCNCHFMPVVVNYPLLSCSTENRWFHLAGRLFLPWDWYFFTKSSIWSQGRAPPLGFATRVYAHTRLRECGPLASWMVSHDDW